MTPALPSIMGKKRRRKAPPLAIMPGIGPCQPDRFRSYWNNRSTAWLACEASDRAVVDSCCRVCKARRLAPSSLESASVRLSAPDCSVLIIALVKSWRICTVDRFEPKAWACERSVVSALVRSVEAAAISVVPPQLLAALLMLRPDAEKSTAAIVTLE